MWNLAMPVRQSTTSALANIVRVHMPPGKAEIERSSAQPVARISSTRGPWTDRPTWRWLTSTSEQGTPSSREIGREHVGTPVTHAPLACRLLLEKTHTTTHTTETHYHIHTMAR